MPTINKKSHGMLFCAVVLLCVTSSTSFASNYTVPPPAPDNSSAVENDESAHWNSNRTNYSQMILAEENSNASTTQLDVVSLLGFDNAPAAFEVSILLQATGSIRLRSSDAAGIDDAVLQWHTYCEEYMQDASQDFGFEKSPFLHSYDWVRIDSTRLDVLFVCIYPKVWGDGPACLGSNETMQNTSDITDMCSALTLGGFGESLLSRNTGKLVVTTNQTLETFFKHWTNAYVLNSVQLNRLSISASFGNISLLIPLQNLDPRTSIFDKSIAPMISTRFFCADRESRHCPAGQFSLSAGQRCTQGFGFFSGHGICLSYDRNQPTRRRSAAMSYCNGMGATLTYPSNYEQVQMVSCMVGGTSNVWALGTKTGFCSNPRDGNNNRGAFSPPIPYVSLWASGQPSGCSENSLQIRSNGDWNDEDDTNDQTRAVCQRYQNCQNCDTNHCPQGQVRDSCTDEQNRNSWRSSNAGCVGCYFQACPADSYTIPCSGHGRRIHATSRAQDPHGYNQCPGCHLTAHSTCASGSYLPRCLSGATSLNTCQPCHQTPCTSTHRGASLNDVNGYFIRRCNDARNGVRIDATCVVCTQDCSLGFFRPRCSGLDFGMTACQKCADHPNLADASCPANHYKNTCVSGSSTDDDGLAHFGRNSCRKCGELRVSVPGSTLITQCTCVTGSIPSTTNPNNCQMCPIGSYQVVNPTDGALSCTHCADATMTTLAEGASSASACLCPAGTFQPAGLNVTCVTCPLGSFSTELGASVCQSCQQPTIPSNVCLAGIPEISSGVSLLAFDRFQENTTVRTILDRVTPLNGTVSWQSGDKVTVYNSGTRGQNPVVLERTPAGSWSPANVDPIHQMHTVYEISATRSGTPRRIMSFEWQTALATTALGAYNQTIGTGSYYLRKNRRNDGKINHFTPMSVRLLNTNPSTTVAIQYAA